MANAHCWTIKSFFEAPGITRKKVRKLFFLYFVFICCHSICWFSNYFANICLLFILPVASHFSFSGFTFLLLCFSCFVDDTRYFREQPEWQRSCYVSWWQTNGNSIYLDEFVFIDEWSVDFGGTDRNYGYDFNGGRIDAPVFVWL